MISRTVSRRYQKYMAIARKTHDFLRFSTYLSKRMKAPLLAGEFQKMSTFRTEFITFQDRDDSTASLRAGPNEVIFV